MQSRYSKLVVKDGSGNLFQILPEIKTDRSINPTSNLPVANSVLYEKFQNLENTILEYQETALTAKEIGILSTEPTTANTSSIDNEGLVFWSEGMTAGQPAGSPVLLSGNQTVEGQKKFLGGLYGGAYTLGSSEWAFDLTKATCFTKTILGNGTFSFSNIPEATACCITVILINGGNYTIYWPASVKWTENVTPTLTQNGTDVLTFITCTGGNVWYGTTTCIGVTA